jgi:hypothetical protein
MTIFELSQHLHTKRTHKLGGKCATATNFIKKKRDKIKKEEQ